MMIFAATVVQFMVTSPAIAVGVVGHVEQTTTAGRIPVSRFDQIEEGASIITHAESSAQLRLASGSLLRVGPHSELSMAQLEHGTPAGKRQESLKLIAGRIWARVTSLFGESTFEIDIGTAVAGVRGTSFVVEVHEGQGRFVLLEGTIDLLREGTTLRLDQPGSFVDTSAGGFGQPGSLAAEQLRDLQREVGGVSGVMVAQLAQLQQRQKTTGDDGGGGREASRGDINGPSQLVDSPTAASPAVTIAPAQPPAGPAALNIVIKLPAGAEP